MDLELTNTDLIELEKQIIGGTYSVPDSYFNESAGLTNRIDALEKEIIRANRVIQDHAADLAPDAAEAQRKYIAALGWELNGVKEQSAKKDQEIFDLKGRADHEIKSRAMRAVGLDIGCVVGALTIDPTLSKAIWELSTNDTTWADGLARLEALARILTYKPGDPSPLTCTDWDDDE